MATNVGQNTEEERAWEVTAAAADEGRGIILQGVDTNSRPDMNELYAALAVKGIGPKSRLRVYIQRLQAQAHQQQQIGLVQLPTVMNTKKESRAANSMMMFFNQRIMDLELNADSDRVRVSKMGWFDVQISSIYWRHCYSYILCSTIAFFEAAFSVFSRTDNDEEKRFESMALTGVQGTGKSILGGIIGLVLAKVFGWQVQYTWNCETVSFGNPDNREKVISIVDFSRGQAKNLPSGFVLVVSSANADRWHDISQQQTWSEEYGNYIFIDTASEDELKMIAGKQFSPESYKYAGGVPRLCRKEQKAVKKLVDNAIKNYDVSMLVNNLSQLKDVTSTKYNSYPGLVGHTVPTNCFRNSFELCVASPYVAQQLLKIMKEDRDQKLKSLLSDLLDIPKARGFAGWIWEPLLSMKMNDQSSTITIVGSKLPASPETTGTLFDSPAASIHCIEFSSLDEFLAEAKGCVTTHNTVFAKARSDNFAAFDAILIMKKEDDSLTIAAIQLTVAENRHPVLQSKVIEFVRTCNSLDEQAKLQLWFLQPEQSLSYFGFVALQAMQFDRITFKTTGDDNSNATQTTSRSRKRTRTSFLGNMVPSDLRKGRMQSNDKDYWDQTVRDLEQYVGIVRLKTNSDATPTTEITEAMKKALDTKNPKANRSSNFDDLEPSGRTWRSTIAIMEELKNHMHHTLVGAIERDIELDRQSLEDA